MSVSDATRTGVDARLRRSAAEANEARAKAEAVREIVKTEVVEAAGVQKAGRAVMTVLGKRPTEWMTTKQIRAAVPGRIKSYLGEALDALVRAGSVEVEEIDHNGQAGRRYRSRS
jgi:hypothetical protein